MNNDSQHSVWRHLPHTFVGEVSPSAVHTTVIHPEKPALASLRTPHHYHYTIANLGGTCKRLVLSRRSDMQAQALAMIPAARRSYPWWQRPPRLCS
jgi:hypothetical protein